MDLFESYNLKYFAHFKINDNLIKNKVKIFKKKT